MKIHYYGYNSFVISSKEKKIAIDPGGELYVFRWLTSLIPQSEWGEISHIFVTHGDPDHHWHTDRVAEVSGALVICNREMVEERSGIPYMLGPRDRGIAFTTALENIATLSVEETLEIDGMTVRGLSARHGPLSVTLGPFSKTLTPGPEERVGWGSMGYKIQLDGKTIVNCGDTLLLEEAWSSIPPPDLLLLPIGGSKAGNTMNEEDALRALEVIKPKHVIPCHYNLPFLFKKNANPADTGLFKEEAAKKGIHCILLERGGIFEL